MGERIKQVRVGKLPFNQTDVKTLKMALEEKLDDLGITKEDLDLLKKLKKKGLRPNEILNLSKALAHKTVQEKKDYYIGKSHVKFGIISDGHRGNINYDPKLMEYACQEFSKAKVDFVIDAGDIMDGWYQNRPQSLFEQNAIGLDQQLNLAVKEMSQIKQKLYYITGNHEYNTFMRGAGIEVGSYLEELLIKNKVKAVFLGNAEGDIKLRSGTTIKILHPDGGTAYALSYRPQKIIESLEGGKKPNVLIIGHYHKAEYLFYRNVHCFQAGTLCGQTKFMKGKAIPAHKGFWIVELFTRKGGQIDKITPQFYPAYD